MQSTSAVAGSKVQAVDVPRNCEEGIQNCGFGS